MTVTQKIVPTILKAHDVPMNRLRLFNPEVCLSCSQRCGDILPEAPEECPNRIIHALTCDHELGYFEAPRRSGKTQRLVSIAEEFEKVGASTLFVVPMISYASQLRGRYRFGRQRETKSFRELKKNGLYGRRFYVFVDEVLPNEMKEVWDVLSSCGCVFVTGYFTNRD